MTDEAGRVLFGTWPTPLEPAPRLGERLGLRPADLWIKRDDLTGLGGGGNKVRKLEFTCAEALAGGATTLVTTGAAQSNHARLTAAAGARLGLDVVLVLGGGPAGTGNLTLNGLLGARTVWVGDADRDEAAERVAGELRAAGELPAIIPFGGSSEVGARGYAVCGAELEKQTGGDLAHAVVAVGSGGTMAGLVAALGPDRVLGVDTGATPDAPERVARMITPAPEPDALRLRRDQVGPGYGRLTPAARQAMRDAARLEGLILDPVYTAKALAGLAAAVSDGDVRPGDRTVFVHTGGLPGLFGHPAAEEFAAPPGA